MKDLMDIPFSELETWKSGDGLTKEKLNQPVRALNELRRTAVESPRQKLPTPRLTRKIGGGGSAGIVEMRLLQVFADYLRCRPVDLTLPDAAVNVAKPFGLRQSSYDGRTIQGITYAYTSPGRRIASGAGPGGTVEEVHILTPSYVVGFDLIAVQSASALFVLNADLEPVPMTDDSGEPILLLSANDIRDFLEDVDV